MDEYVTHGQLVEIIELFYHLSIVNAVVALIVYFGTATLLLN